MKRTRIIAGLLSRSILSLAITFAAIGAKAVDSLTMADFNHSIKLMVDGYTGASTLTNFPVLVRLSESTLPGFHYADMSAMNQGKTTGKDLAFFAKDGTRLASENDTWVHNGESLAWVRLPEMTNGTEFVMCYNVDDGVYVTNANPWVEYVGVWHLKESGGKSKAVIKNSTTNNLLGITSSKGSPEVVSAGQIGAARRIATDTGNNPGYDSGITIALTNATDLAAVNGLAPEFTASFWYYPDGDSSNWEYLLSRKNTDDYPAWGLQFGDERTDKWGQLRIYGGNGKEFATNTGQTYGTGNSKGINIPDGGKNQWHKLDCVWTSDAKFNLYIDGVLVAAGALSGNKAAANGELNLSIGGALAPASGKGGRGFKGVMDEVRLRPGIPSADWVKADYDTVTNSSFVALAPPEVLTVSWTTGDPLGVSDIRHDAVVFGGTVLNTGEADTCAIEYKIWRSDESEPEGWATLTNDLVTGASFDVDVSGLTKLTTYNYKLRAVNGVEYTDAISGLFTTEAIVIAWSTASGTNGFSTISYDFAIASGTVAKLGDASCCDIQIKLWGPGETKPAEWTTVYENLGLNDSFNAAITNLLPGTTYDCELCAFGDDDERSDILAGSFTTEGEAGEVIGSEYTHYFYDGTNAYWVANDFERYLEFTVTGYTGTETLRDFPVLVEVRREDTATNGFTYDDFYHYDGKDIAFVDEKGHIVPHEIDTWNRNGMSLFWVKLPEMNNGTKFTMCYRSPLVDPLPDVGNAFEKYVGVWHMNETGDGVVNLKDSTVNDFETETHAASTAYGSGQIGGARRVAQQTGSAASYGRIIAFDHDDILRTGVGNVFTYSGWYKLVATPPKWAYLVSRKSEDADRGWGVQYDSTSTQMLRVWSGSRAKGAYKTFLHANTGTSWHYWTFVFDGSVNPDGTTNKLFHAYLDGSAVVNNVVLNYDIANDETADFNHLCVVGQQNGTGAFNGYVDECRYSKGVRSADWIKAEYDSTLQAKNWDKDSRFVTKGTVSKGVDSLVPVVVWERGEGLPDTILDVSYAYVQFAGQVTYCGTGADSCRIEYRLWPDGETMPEEWTTLLSDVVAGTSFSIPVTGLKQDMLYNFRIRAVNRVDGQERQTREHVGQFRTNGNMELGDVEGELMRVGDKFVHRYRAGYYNFTTPDYVTNVEIMVVGGGGAGGYKVGGGGGGGGLYYNESFPVETNTAYRVHVGQGGNAATSLAARSGNGESSYFALASDEANPLIMVPGGGAGGSYVDDDAIKVGAVGGSGGGGTYAAKGGGVTSNEVDGVWTTYGYEGGVGNDSLDGGAIGKVAAGGGGGAKREGLGATFDSWSTGGAGGVGMESDITGETLFYGAGGGGGYIYRFKDSFATNKTGTVTKTTDFTKPGGGGSGIGGNAADVRNGTLATSGVENTGAGGGGGSAKGRGDGTKVDETESTYWQGGDGGDGVVLISYEAHGRDPISEEPRITMSRCAYSAEKGFAEINYRAYWAGIQAQTNDVYVLYSTVSYEDVANGGGEMTNLVANTIGIGVSTFTPPSVGYTYWVRLIAKKDANSYMYSDEIASFEVAAVEVNGATPKLDDDNITSNDYAEISYNLYDKTEDARLYCYWSEIRSDLEGNTAPSGSTVNFLDLGVGRQANPGKFRIEAEDGLDRNHSYYVRLATGNESGTRYFLSKQIVMLEMIDKPRVIFNEASWTNLNYSATVNFLLSTASLDPDIVDLYAIYSGNSNQVMYAAKGMIDPAQYNLLTNDDVTVVNLGACSLYPDDMATSAQFPMWSPIDTNYWARLVLVTNDYPVCYSERYQTITTIKAVPANTLLIYAYANPKIGCYGDEPQELDYVLSYGGLQEGPGWNNWTNLFTGTLSGSLSCAVTNSLAPSGQHEISNELGNLGLGHAGTTYQHEGDVFYYYLLCTVPANYTVTNAQFTASIADTNFVYTGEAIDIGALVFTFTGLRNEQPVTYEFRVGTNDWSSTLPSTYSNIWTQVIQYRASAPSHDGSSGTFKITIEPAPLSAEISAADMNYLGRAQTPTITTNVYGLVHGEINPLECEFRDEVGEWSTELPEFTNPGTYKLFFRVSAPNHTTFVTNCTFKINGWDYQVNMDGREGFEVPLRVTAPSWLLEATGETAEHFADNTDNKRYKNLDSVCDNGLKLWQNYIIDRKKLDKHLVAAIRQHGSRVNENAFVMYFPGVDALRNTGLRIHYRTERMLRDESAFSTLEDDDDPEMNVPLGPHDPTGLYRFSMVLTPTNSAYTGESVLASATTVGVIRVSSVLTNFVAAVPWKSMAIDTTNIVDVTVADMVNPNGISGGDRILYYNYGTGVFSEWSHANSTWDAVTTVSELGVSQSPADTTRIASTNAFWLARNNPGGVGATNYVYLVGRHTGEDYEFALNGGTVGNPGGTLVANPTMYDVALDDLVFVDGEGNPATPGANDYITVMNVAGVTTKYTRRNGHWGCMVTRKINPFQTQNVWTRGGSVPSGTGFWYYRAADSVLKIKFRASK